MDCSMTGYPILHNLPEFAQTMPTEMMMPSNHLTPCPFLFLLPSIFPSIRVFSNELALPIRWPKYWSFSVSPSNEYSGLIFFRIDWFWSPCCPKDSEESFPAPQLAESVLTLAISSHIHPSLNCLGYQTPACGLSSVTVFNLPPCYSPWIWYTCFFLSLKFTFGLLTSTLWYCLFSDSYSLTFPLLLPKSYQVRYVGEAAVDFSILKFTIFFSDDLVSDLSRQLENET